MGIKSFLFIVRLATFVMATLASANSLAYVSCSNVPVKDLMTGTEFEPKPSIIGPYVALEVDPQYCQARSGEDITAGITLIVDSIASPNLEVFEIRRFWAGLLLAANSAATKVIFSASQAGRGSDGRLIVKPYHFTAQ